MKYSKYFFGVFFTFFIFHSFAQNLNTAFGDYGVVETRLERGFASPRSVITQEDGKFIVGGDYLFNGDNNIGIARYTSSGVKDSTFATNGLVNLDINGRDDFCLSVALQSDGKILVLGYTGKIDHFYDFVLIRINVDGSIDTTFGEDGVVIANIEIFDKRAFLEIQDDGKILIGGSSGQSDFSNSSFSIIRYNTDGTLDNSFGSNGIVIIQEGIQHRVTSIEIQQDGKILLFGSRKVGTHYNLVVLRFDTDGTLDSSFGEDGVLSLDGDTSFGRTKLLPDGKIVILGLHNRSYAVLRYNSDWTLDDSFGADGRVVTTVGDCYDYPNSLIVHEDGKIIILGSSQFYESDSNYPEKMAVIKYNSDGSLDSTFNDDGIFLYDPSDLEYSFAYSFNETNDSNLIIVGNARRNTGRCMVFCQLDANGTLDTLFGDNGRIIQDVFKLYGTFTSIKTQSDGKIIATGKSNLRHDFFMIRFNADGSVDQSFGDDGIVLTRKNVTMNSHVTSTKLEVLEDDRIVLTGTDYTGGFMVVIQYNRDGTVDTSFGNEGMVEIDVGDIEKVAAIAVQQDGKILITGNYRDSISILPSVALVRLNPDGTIDASFGTDGVSMKSFEHSTEIEDIAIQADGKIVTVGTTSLVWGEDDFLTMRFNPDGSFDNSFADEGIAVIDFYCGHNDVAKAVRIQKDGKIVVGGSSEDGFAVVRLLTNGTLDVSFGNEGKVQVNVFDGGDEGESIQIQADGKIIIIGTSGGFDSAGWDRCCSLVRFDVDGNLDDSFGNGGIVASFQNGLWNSIGFASTILSDHNILVSGTYDWDAHAFFIANYLAGLVIDVADFSSPGTFSMIYPNPIHNSANFEYSLVKDEIVSLNLYDFSGRLVQNFFTNVKKNHGKQTETLNFNPSIPSGNYVLVLSNHEGEISIKITKD